MIKVLIAKASVFAGAFKKKAIARQNSQVRYRIVL